MMFCFDPNQDTSPEMQKLEGLTDASSNTKTEKAHRWDDAPEDFVADISVMVRKNNNSNNRQFCLVCVWVCRYMYLRACTHTKIARQ